MILRNKNKKAKNMADVESMMADADVDFKAEVKKYKIKGNRSKIMKKYQKYRNNKKTHGPKTKEESEET